MFFAGGVRYWCSSTTTLIMNRLEFGGQKLSKCPDMIGEPRRHPRGSGEPLRLNQSQDMLILVGERQSQTHVRSFHIVEGLEEDHPLPQALAVFAEAGRLTRQRCQGLTQGQVHPFDQGRADCEAQLRQALGSQHDARAERQQLALFLLLDPLPVDQIWMGLTEGLTGAPPLAGSRTRRYDVEGRDEGRQIAREAIAEERRDARDTRLCGCHDFLGGVERARPHHGRDHQAKLGGKADPQTHCRPSSLSGKLSPAVSVSHACLRAMKFHISSSCTWVTGRSLSRCALISAALSAARCSHASTVASVTPRTKEIPARSTLTKSILRAIITFSSGVFRSKKTVSRVSEKGVPHVVHWKMRRFPLCVRYVEIARMFPRLIICAYAQAGFGHGWPQALGVRMVNPPVREISITHLTRGWATFLFQSTSG